jgi:hypothetical protein
MRCGLKSTACAANWKSEGAVGRLELLLHERLTKIDALTAQVDQLRHRNKQLDEEAERLAAIIRIMPQLDPAMLAPK